MQKNLFTAEMIAPCGLDLQQMRRTGLCPHGSLQLLRGSFRPWGSLSNYMTVSREMKVPAKEAAEERSGQ